MYHCCLKEKVQVILKMPLLVTFGQEKRIFHCISVVWCSTGKYNSTPVDAMG